MASVMMTRDNVLRGGDFVCAVCENDLFGALSRADSTCLENILPIVQSYHYCHIENYEPEGE